MTVYVDLLFGVNTIINYLLLRGSAAIGGTAIRFWRLLAAAGMGGLYAVAAVLPGLEPLNGLFFQMVSAGIMLITAFGCRKHTVKQALLFFALSFSFSGIVLLAVRFLEPDMVLMDSHAYYGVTAPALLLLAGLCYGMAAVVLRGFGTHTGGDLVELHLSLGGQEVTLRALRDTGNTLYDPLSGQPVLVAGWQVLSRLLPQAGLQQAQFRDPAGLLEELSGQFPMYRFRLIPFRAVGTESGLLPAVWCSCRVGKKSQRKLVAFTAAGVSEQGTYEALLGGLAA